ncbi:hypothetical protein D3C85_1081730 [compost metagenome]
MLTEHPAMVELLYNHFCSSVVVHELQQDMSAKLEDKYGKNFKKIIQKHIDGKVPEPKKVDEGKLVAVKLHAGNELAGELGSLNEGAPVGEILGEEKSDTELAEQGQLELGKSGQGKIEEGKSAQGKTEESKSGQGKRKKKK